MKILLFSDSHRHVDNMSKALLKNKCVDMVIYLADINKDRIISRFFGLKSDRLWESHKIPSVCINMVIFDYTLNMVINYTTAKKLSL